MHESAMEEALHVYNSEAVGAGVARKKFEKLLIAAFKRSFEVHLICILLCFSERLLFWFHIRVLVFSYFAMMIIITMYAQENMRKVTIEAELKCVKMVEKMDEQIWTICQSSETTLGHALEVKCIRIWNIIVYLLNINNV